jgi:hypothetical protein
MARGFELARSVVIRYLTVTTKHEASWQSGDATDCNSVYSGSIPDDASNNSYRPLLVNDFYLDLEPVLPLKLLLFSDQKVA